MPVVFPLSWPRRALAARDCKLELKTTSRSGGQNLAGVEQVVRNPAARWAIKLVDVAVRTPDQIMLWRTFEGQLEGRLGTIRIPIYDARQAPSGLMASRVPFSDGSTFSDGSVFRSISCLASLTADAASNATTLAVQWSGLPPQPGQHFSLGNNLHRIVAVDGQVSIDGLTFTTQLTVRPWTRAAWPAATRLEFDDPVCLCRLASDDGMALDLDFGRVAHPSVDLVEAF